MDKKLVVSKKVDEAIKTMRSYGMSDYYITKMYRGEHECTPLGTPEPIKIITSGFNDENELLRALVVGYKVEKSKPKGDKQ